MIFAMRRIVTALAAVLFTVASLTPLSAQQATVTISTPNSSVILDPGYDNKRTTTIRWTSQNVSGNVAIDLFRDGKWETIIPSTPNDGVQAWNIGGPATSLGRFRARTLSGPVASDVSDANIAIFGPYYKGYWYGGYCTEYAARGFDLVAPAPGLDWVGNAGSWYNNAKNWRVTTKPIGAVPGAIGVWNDADGLGHVALFMGYDKDTNGNMYAKFSEQNWGLIEDNNPLFWKNVITKNFGRVTTVRLPVSNLDRPGTPTLLFKFTGFILPQRR